MKYAKVEIKNNESLLESLRRTKNENTSCVEFVLQKTSWLTLLRDEKFVDEFSPTLKHKELVVEGKLGSIFDCVLRTDGYLAPEMQALSNEGFNIFLYE